MQKIDRTRRKRRYLVLSFFVPFGVMLLCFILGGLWPFGDRQVLAHDMWHQYYPFFVSFREKLRQQKPFLILFQKQKPFLVKPVFYNLSGFVRQIGPVLFVPRQSAGIPPCAAPR